VSPTQQRTNSIESDAWKGAVLVTPRHGVRTAWNTEANRRHCSHAKEQLFICPAEDTVAGRPLTIAERWSMATKKTSQGQGGNSRRNALSDNVEIAVGMEVMVTVNIDTELDVANGARGIVHKIILDPREDASSTSKEVKLCYQPACVLVRLNRTKAPKLSGLEMGIVPIVPFEQKSNLTHNSKTSRATRRQLPITSAYAFTDYRSQGQTIKHVIVDIGRPPNGKLTPFNAYVALSRSSGRETIRLLRDFDDILFTKAPSAMLEEEDRRLYDLDRETQVKYERDVDIQSI
jgi:hypothetical protein